MLLDKVIKETNLSSNFKIIEYDKNKVIEIVRLDMTLQVFNVVKDKKFGLIVETNSFFKWRENKNKLKKYLSKYLSKQQVDELINELKDFWFHT